MPNLSEKGYLLPPLLKVTLYRILKEVITSELYKENMNSSTVHKLLNLLKRLKAGQSIEAMEADERMLLQSLLDSVKKGRAASSVTTPEKEAGMLVKEMPEDDRYTKYEEENANLEKALKEKEEFVAQLEQQFARIIERVESSEEMTKMTVNYLTAQSASLEKEKQELTIKYQELKDAIGGRQEESILKEQFDTLNEKIDEWFSVNTQLKEDNLQLKIELQKKENGKEVNMNQLTQQVDQLTNLLDIEKGKSQELGLRLQELTNQLQKAEGASQQAVTEKNELKQKTDDALVALKKVEQDAKEIANTFKEKEQVVEVELKQLRIENNTLKKQLSDLRADVQPEESGKTENLQADTLLEGQIVSLKEQIEVLTEENNRLANREMAALKEVSQTVENPAQQVVGLEESLTLTQQFNKSYFKNYERIEEQFPQSFYFSYPSQEYNGHVMHMTEKFGITYLVMVRSPFQGLAGQIFNMVANFTLSNVIRTKKYINSSRLIEEFLYAIRPVLMLIGGEHQEEEIKLCVSLVDVTNLEIEYASNGSSLYYVQRGELKKIYSESQHDQTKSVKKFGLNNSYQVKKLNLLKKDKLIFLSEDTVESLHELLSKSLHDEPAEVESSLHAWASKNSQMRDFLFVQIGF